MAHNGTTNVMKLLDGKQIPLDCVCVTFVFILINQSTRNLRKIKRRLDEEEEEGEGEGLMNKCTGDVRKQIEACLRHARQSEEYIVLTWTTTLIDFFKKTPLGSILMAMVERSLKITPQADPPNPLHEESDFYSSHKQANYANISRLKYLPPLVMDQRDQIRSIPMSDVVDDGDDDDTYNTYTFTKNNGELRARCCFRNVDMDQPPESTLLNRSNYVEERLLYVELSSDEYSSNSLKLFLAALEDRIGEIGKKTTNIDKVLAIKLADYLGMMPLINNRLTNISHQINTTKADALRAEEIKLL